MKDKLKNTLEHEVELLGRSISVLAIAGLLVVGGASAALLDTFAETEGTSQVEAALEFEDENDLTATWNLENVVAGDSVSGESATLTNNLEEPVTVDAALNVGLDTDVSSDFYDESKPAEGIEGGYLVLANGETFTNFESVDEGLEGQGTASTDYVATSEGAAVKASFDSTQGHVHSGLWFDIGGVEVDGSDSGSDSVTVETTSETRPDWVYVVATINDSENAYVLGDYGVGTPEDGETSYTVDISEMTGPSFQAVDGEGSPVTVDQIESRDDFTKTSVDVSPENIDEVYSVVAATGTNGEDSRTQVYKDVKFNGETLFVTRPVNSQLNGMEVPPGSHELGFAADFDTAVVPGTYSFSADINPPAE